MNPNSSDGTKKTKLPNGGSITTSTGKDGSRNITIANANSLHIGSTYTVGEVYSGQSASRSNPSSFYSGSSSSRQAGTTIKKVSFLQLNKQEIEELSTQTHKVYRTSDEYKKDSSNSSAKPRP
jgi:hypothetical protein